MANSDAERLLDENFIATDESRPFDCLEDENNCYVDFKYKKKNGFNFTSSWRKPKIGRRKMRSIGKNLDKYDMAFNDDSTRGKIVKGRESFETFASIPLSDFDEVKDNLPFLNLRVDESKMRMSLKEKTTLNPKMFLNQPPVNRTNIKNKFKKETTVDKNLEEEESLDIFKPIHNTCNDDVFDAFQILPKESPSKVKLKDDTEQKEKEEESDDLYNKENVSKESLSCGHLYKDHGPILSSLSDDTLHSDSVRGEQFLEDEIEPKSQWNPILNPNFEELEEETWVMPNTSNKEEFQQVETVKSIYRSAKTESSALSFSDRLKLFQSKDTQTAPKFGSDSTKSYSKKSHSIMPNLTKSNTSRQVTNLLDSKLTEDEEEVNNHLRSTMVSEMSDFEKPAFDLENRASLVSSNISEPVEQTSDETIQLSTPKVKNIVTMHFNYLDKNTKSSGIERNHVKQLQTNIVSTAPIPSYQTGNSKQINDKKNFETKKYPAQSSEIIQSKVVDLSLIDSYKNRNDNVQQIGSNEPILCSVDQKVDAKEAGEKSNTYRFQRMSDSSMRSTRPYSTNYRSSLHSQKNANEFNGKTLGKAVESEFKPGIKSHEGSSQPVTSNELNDHSTSVAHQAPIELETKNANLEKEKPRDSFMAATLLFGGKREPSKNKFDRKICTNIHRTDKEEISKEKKGTTELDNQESTLDALKFDQNEPIDTKKNKSSVFGTKKSFKSVTSEVDAEDRTPASNGVHKSTIKSSVVRKPSLNPESEKIKVGCSVPSLETATPSTKIPNAISSDTEIKAGSEHKTYNESTANTSVSTLTCDSVLPASFAQQSANIFGVTLSKTRRKKIESASRTKGHLQTKKSIETDACAEESESQTDFNDSQATRLVSDAVESETSEDQKQKSVNEESNRRKISTSSISIHSIEKGGKFETSQVKQEERLPVVEQPMKKNKNNQVKSLDDGMQSDTSNLKEISESLPQKVKTRSISARLKMFEKANARSQKGSKRDCNKIQDIVRSDSPKSIDRSGSSSCENLSVATKRRDTRSGITTVTGVFESELAQVETSPYKNQSDHDEESDAGDRRKSSMETMGTSSSFKSQPKSFGMTSHVLVKSEITPNTKDNNFGNDIVGKSNSLKKRSMTFESEHKEKNKTEHLEVSASDTSSPDRTAYSMRRKFFEKLDRKRLQASKSRPLVTQADPMQINTESHREHEIEQVNDDSLCGDNDLPMFVEVEEDFMLGDNISTCLSASESRSVVCKPDALLYSVSQKAIALMSAKAESNTTRSYARAYRDEDKGTIDNGFKLNREESTAKFRSRFARKKATNNEQEVVDNAQDKDDKDKGLLANNQRANKFRTSDFSQRYNRFEKKKVSPETRHQSDEEETSGSTDIRDTYANHKKNQSIQKVTTAPHNRSSYNRFERKNVDRGMHDEPKTGHCSSNKVTIDAVDNLQDGSDKSQLSMNSKEMDPANTNEEDQLDSTKLESMSIRTRRKFFESQCARGSASRSKSQKKDSTALGNSRKSSVSVESNRSSSFNNGAKSRSSAGSGMTRLVGESIVSQCELLTHNTASESRTSMGTLDYSLPSSSSRPSDFSTRISSASSNTSGHSSARFYKNGYSSTVNRSSTCS